MIGDPTVTLDRVSVSTIVSGVVGGQPPQCFENAQTIVNEQIKERIPIGVLLVL